MLIAKLTIVLLLGLLGIFLSACTMTISVDSLEAGSTTSSSWSKNSASEVSSRAGVNLATSQGSGLALDNNAATGLKRALNRYTSK